MIVWSADGERLGKIVTTERDGFIIEKGLFFKKEFFGRYDDVARSGDNDVYLLRTRDELATAAEHARAPLRAVAPLKAAEARSSEREPDRVVPVVIEEEERVSVRAVAAPTTTTEEVRIPLAEEEVTAHTEMHESGRVRIHKQVETAHQQVSVPVTREEVHVERVPVEGIRAEGGAADIGESTVIVPIYEEEVEISKRPVVREEVRVTKEVHHEERTVDTTVRKEKVDIEEEGEARKRKPPKAA